MTMAPTYGCFGCVDFANNARTKAYVAWACRMGKFRGDPGATLAMSRSWCVCEVDDAEWTNPADDEVCWYDPAIPESADFLGIVIEQAKGVRSSTFKREVNDAINRGSVLGQPTISGKQIVLEVFIIATSIAGQNYGIQWLERQFEDDQRCPAGGSTCASCQGQLFTLRVHCYDPSLPVDEQPVDKGLHSWSAAGTIDGFVPDEERYPVGRVNCEKVLAGSLTIATESADSYSTEPPSDPVTFDATNTFRALGNCLTEVPLPSTPNPSCPTCSPFCDPCREDPGCDCSQPSVLIEPEQSFQVSPCFTNAVCRCISSAQVTDIPAGYETALRISMQAGFDPSNVAFSRFGMRNAVVRIWERPALEETDNGIVMPTTLAEYEALTARLDPCAELGISWIPAGAELVIDGLSGRSWLLCDGRCLDHSARVHTISGTVFPLKARCTDLIITCEWDCLNVQGDDTGDKVPSSVKLETFLGFRL